MPAGDAQAFSHSICKAAEMWRPAIPQQIQSGGALLGNPGKALERCQADTDTQMIGIMEQPPQPPGGRPGADAFSGKRIL